MDFFSWARWLRSVSNPTRNPIVRRPNLARRAARYRPRLEHLEDRLAPATFTWVGLGSGVFANSWSNPANWSSATGTAPTGSGSEDLVFKSGSAQLSNFNDLNNAVFNSITFSGAGYTLAGQPITVGGTVQYTGATGQINVGAGLSGETIKMSVNLGGAGSGQQAVTVGAFSTLTMSGLVSSAPGAPGWIKQGTGTLILSGIVNTFSEPFTIAQGIVQLTSPTGLGTSNTTVQQNAQLQLNNVGSIANNLTLSGFGPVNDGALLNVSGNNTIAGNITLGNNVYLGTTTGSLEISGQISDLAAGFSVTKVGPGQLVFDHVGGNIYRGTTTINNGILTIRDPNALGNSPSFTNSVVVNSTITGTGTLQLDNEDVTRPGFTVANELLTLNGVGFNPGTGNIGALDNFNGNNIWSGNVTLGSAPPTGSPVSIAVDSQGITPTLLLISGVIGDRTTGGPLSLTKIGTGKLIFTSVNTYQGGTSVVQGTLNVEDSKALGAGTAFVSPGAALELQLQGDNIGGLVPNPIPDSVTGTVNQMSFATPVFINGTGINNTGALHSISGINTWSGGITLGGAAAIGVEPDPHPSATNAYFAKDYSLTVIGAGISGSSLVKVDLGQLILPVANSYTGTTDIQQGWITVQDNGALGPQLSKAVETVRPYTTVERGAALHVKPLVTGTFLSLDNNFILNGSGINHPFGLINQMGALENIDGPNILSGIIQLNGAVGIGVEQIDPLGVPPNTNIPSQLTLTGYLWDFIPPSGLPVSGGINKLGSQRLIIQGLATYTGAVDIKQGVLLAQSETALGTGVNTTTVESGTALELGNTVTTQNGGLSGGIGVWGEHLILNGAGNPAFGDDPLTVLTSTSTTTGPFDDPIIATDNMWTGPIILKNSLALQIQKNCRLNLTGTISDGANPADLIMDGPGELALAGSNTYRGSTFVNRGVLTVENNQALGGAATAAVQTVTIPSSVTAFTLTFNSAQTQPIAYTGNAATDAAAIQSALNKLNTIGGAPDVGGSVTVVGTSPGVFSVVFLGSLLGFSQPQMSAAVTGGSGTIGVVTTTAGSGGTIVANGASLQLAAGVTIGGKPLMVIGQGSSNAPAVPPQWFQVGPAPVNNGQTASTENVSGRVTGIAVNPSDPNVIYLATAGGGAWKTNDGGKSWRPLFDSVPEIQSVTINNTSEILQFTLTFVGKDATGTVVTQTTTPITYNPNNLNQVAVDMQNALNALSNIGGVSGFVTVTQLANVFTVTFGGAGLAGNTTRQLSGAVTSGSGTVSTAVIELGTQPLTAMYLGAITFDSATNTIYIGTGETNFFRDIGGNPETPDSYYGTGIYASSDFGATWSLLTGAYVQQLNINPNVSAFTLRISGLDLNGNPFTDTTASIPYVAANFAQDATAIQNAINALPDLIALGVSVTVTPATFGNIFSITFAGPVNGHNLSQFTVPSATGGTVAVTTISPVNPFYGLAISKIVIDPQTGAMFVSCADILSADTPNSPPLPRIESDQVGSPPKTTPGIWRLMNGTWFCLTNQVSAFRGTLNGQLGFPPGTPGPDDDFRLSFPQSNVTWSDVSVVDIDTFNDGAGHPFPIPAPVVYAALGTAAGDANNAVYRCRNPLDAAPLWYIGDPGQPQNQVERITINAPAGPGGMFNLFFRGTGAPPGAETPAITYSNTVDQSGIIQTDLNGLSTIGGVGGFVTVMQVSQSVTQSVYDVTFQGTLGNSPQPLMTAVWTNLIASVVITITTPGGGADTRSGEFPTGANGDIKFSIVTSPYPTTENNTTVYASVQSTLLPPATPIYGMLLNIYQSTGGGKVWAAINAQPPNFMATQGGYDNAIVTADANTLYVGGMVAPNTPVQQLFAGTRNPANNTFSWRDISLDPTLGGPHTSVHALVVDNQGRLVVGNDGGIWRLEANGTWNDMNGNLATLQINGVALEPTSVTQMFAGSQFNATEQFTNTRNWGTVDDLAGGTLAGNQVIVNPSNPNIVYNTQQALGANTTLLRESLAGGVAGSWNPILNPATGLPLTVPGTLAAPILLDNINNSRLLIGGTPAAGFTLDESLDGGVTFTDIGVNLFGRITTMAVAGFQGIFQPDPAFAGVTDQGANTYTPDTIYVARGNAIFVTKNHGTTWASRNLRFNNVTLTNPIIDLEVDPRNRDTVYAVVNQFQDSQRTPSLVGGQVWKSTDAGQNWTWIGGNTAVDFLPNVPAWKLVIDPRNSNLYVGTDIGVYELQAGAKHWQHFGFGMPSVQVKDLQLNQTTNTLVAGTYGRSVFELFLDAPQTGAVPVTAAVVGLSGSSEWAGPVVLAGAAGANGPNSVAVGAYGSQALRNGITTAQVNFVGSISDLTAGTNPMLVKLGPGTVVLSGANIYGGETDIHEGVLIADNPTALSGTFTLVEPGTALQLESSITNNEPLQLNGDGPAAGFNGHNTGALESIANTNTYTGPITFLTNATIGVDTGSTLTITGAIGESPAGKHFTLTKELGGTLALNDTNTYTGATYVNQGALQIESSGALAGSPQTFVLDGAQIQLQTPSGGAPVVVNEPLSLSGTGISGTGALLDTGGTNTWAGKITLNENPGFSILTKPVGVVALAAMKPADQLIITGQISDDTATTGTSSGLEIVGHGTVTLAGSNSYNGTTYINSDAGGGATLRMQNAGALGTNNTNDIQRLVVFDPSSIPPFGPPGSVTLFLGAQQTTFASNASAATVQAALAALTGIGAGNVAVARTQVIAPVAGTPLPTIPEFIYTIVFQGALAGVKIPLMVAVAVGGASAAVTKVADGGVGTIVQNGAALALDLDPANTGTPQTVSAEALHLSGNGIGGTGALDNLTGKNTWTGAPITLDSASAIGVDGGSLTVRGDVSGLTPAALSKVGTGTLFFPTPNDYQGNTVVQNGILNISDPGALGASLSNEVQAISITGSLNTTYRLTFRGQQTGDIPTDFTNPATLTALQNALAGLSTIGAGNVNATQVPAGGNTYTVTFIGALAGQPEPLMVSSNPSVSVAERILGGLGGTFVKSGGTLQVTNNVTVSTEPLTLTGSGFNNLGALDSPSGNNIWRNSVVLAGDSSIAADTDSSSTQSTLTIDRVISESVTSSKLTKTGTGVLVLAGSNSNTYTGLTSVNDGVLVLNKTGAIAVAGDLSVGDGTPGDPTNELAVLQQDNQIAPASKVTVNSDGVFTVNGHTQTIAALTVNDGAAQTGPAPGLLTVGALTMTGGVLAMGGAGSEVLLAGDVKATSDAATGPATVLGNGGTLALGNATRTFTVNAGAAGAPADLDVQIPITGASSVGLTKAGGGRLLLDADSSSTFAGLFTDNAGTVQVSTTGKIGGSIVNSGAVLQVDGASGAVNLNGGTVSGNGVTPVLGQVGSIDAGSPGTAPSGTISPGDHGPATATGILTANPGAAGEVWGTGTTLRLNLNNAAQGPGPGYDQLVVNGNLNLGGTQISGGGGNNGGASLTGTVGPGVALGNQFTIIRTTGSGTISGIFLEPFLNNVTFIAGQKFVVTYNSQSVVLTRQINNAFVKITSSANPSVYGQDFVFTANVTPEPGANAPFLPGDTVQFTLYDSGHNVIATATSPLSPGGIATFDGNPNLNLVPGSYTVDARFAGDANYAGASFFGYAQTINQSTSSIQLSSGGPANPVFGQSVTVVATVKPSGAGQGTPTGSVTFVVDGGPGQTVNFNASAGGVVPLVVSGLGVGTHSFTASYSGDSNFTGSSTPQTFFITIGKDANTVGLVASPALAVPNQQVTFTATVTTTPPGTGIPSGTVTFFDGSTIIGSNDLSLVSGNYSASVQTSTLAQGAHTIKASYAGNGVLQANSTTINFFVGQITTDTALTSSTGTSPAIFGQPVIFTAKVQNDPTMPSGLPTPNGQVKFVIDGGTSQGGSEQTLALDPTGTAALTLNNLSGGTHTIVANYLGNVNFATSSANLSQVVDLSSVTSLTASPSPSIYGNQVTFTAKVQPGPGMPASSPTPTGTVNFVIDGGPASGGSQSGPLTLTGGQVTYNVSNFGVGTHTVAAQYSGSALYIATNSSTLNQKVLSASTVVLTRTSGPSTSVYSQPITFMATVTATAPNAVPPTGSVVFVIDGGPGNGGSQTAPQTITGGQVSINLSTLSRGSHTITATYSGDANTAPGATTSSLNQTVIADPTNPAVISSFNPANVGQTVTFTATINPTQGGTGTPTGTATFYIDGALTATVTLSGGQASLPVSGLARGTHSVYVGYSGDGNFLSATSNLLSQRMVFLTNTALTASQNPAVSTVPVTLTATVSYVNASGQVSGTVDFVDTTTNTDLGTATVNGATGQASIQASLTTLGVHKITATYSGDANFNSSISPTLNESVVSGTTVSLSQTSANNPSVFTEGVIFRATVTSTVTGAPTPTGSVSFYDGATLLQTANLPAGQNQVSATITNLAIGTRTVTAIYSGDVSNAPSTSAGVSQTVNQDPTTAAVTSNVSTPVYGQPVTFTATISKTGNATAAPTGSVTFIVDGGNPATGGFQQVVPLGGGQATVTANSLTVAGSPHSVQVVYNGSSDGGFGPSNATLPGGQSVLMNDSTTTVVSSANPSGIAAAVRFTATVAPKAPGSGAATGTVDFVVDGGNANAANGGFEQVLPLSGGQASYVVTALARGSHQVKVVYGGDGTNLNGSSGTMTQVVGYVTTTTVTSSLNPCTAGQQVTYTATVAYFNGAGAVTGTVNFYDGSTLIGTGTVSNGVATLAATLQTVGTHTIQASYLGDANFAASGNVMFETVNVAPTQIFGTSSVVGSLFTIYGYALDSNATLTTYLAPATLSITSGPPAGTFISGTTSTYFVNGIAVFGGLRFNRSGTYHLKITSGSLISQDIVIQVP
jgi:autotransporter-associated beta strand protein